MTGSVAAEAATRGPADEVWTVLRLMRWSGEYLEGKGVERGRLDELTIRRQTRADESPSAREHREDL